MSEILESIEKGIIVEVTDVKQAISVDKFVNAIFIGNFDVELIAETIDAVSLPVIASCRIGHHVEARVLEKMGVHIIDESNPNNIRHINKKEFSVPFMCKVNSMEEALLRADEGAAMLRTEWGSIDEVIWLVEKGKEKGLNVKLFPALKIATPADISLLLQMGGDGAIISSDLFRSPNPPQLLDGIVNAARYYNDVDKIVALTKQTCKILPSKTLPSESK